MNEWPRGEEIIHNVCVSVCVGCDSLARTTRVQNNRNPRSSDVDGKHDGKHDGKNKGWETYVTGRPNCSTLFQLNHICSTLFHLNHIIGTFHSPTIINIWFEEGLARPYYFCEGRNVCVCVCEVHCSAKPIHPPAGRLSDRWNCGKVRLNGSPSYHAAIDHLTRNVFRSLLS